MSRLHIRLVLVVPCVLSLPLVAAAQTSGPTKVQRLAVRVGPDLIASPSAVSASQIGGTQQVTLFVDAPTGLTDVTADPATTFASSNPAVASVSAGGLLTFHAPGQAEVSSSYSGSTAKTSVDVDPAKPPSLEVVLGPSGGTLRFPDGTGLDVPPGVLAAATTLGVAQSDLPAGTTMPPGAALVSPTWDFTPSGLSFSSEVQVTLAWSPASVPASCDPESMLVHTLYGGDVLGVEAYTGPDGAEHLVESVNQGVDLAAHTVTVGVRHFSRRALVAALNPTVATLTAPDGTQLQILQHFKTLKPGKGPDNRYGVPNCDDNQDNNLDDVGEFQGVAGSPCGTANDDVHDPIAGRLASSITHIVLHSTAGAATATFSGEVSWAASDRNAYWAHYYVDKDGTIVQISLDTEVAQHVKGNTTAGHAGNGINNNNSIGIEIYSNTGVDNYPGRQVAAVVRLVDFLLRRYPNITPPSAASPAGNIIVHAAQNPPGSVKTDPTGNFRTAVMGSPSLEDIVLRAVRTDTLTGVINARGGDALDTGFPGFGGDVTIEMGDPDLANDFDDSRTSVQVAAGATQALAAGDHMHLLVAGTAKVSADSLLDLDGILYVGPQGTLDARGGFDGKDGFDLDITSDGFVLIEGRVLVNGTDKLGTSEQPPFSLPPFPAGGGSGSGDGGDAGFFRFRSAAAGFLFAPTIVTRGGDGDTSLSSLGNSGGPGGDVILRGRNDEYSTQVIVLARGRKSEQALDQAEVGLPDYLPPPPPFNLMPVVTATPIASGTCHVDPISNPSYVRPDPGERLAIGRLLDATTHQALGNISLLQRGIITVGGMGAVATTSSATAGGGGVGGNILIENQTGGYIRFLDSVQLLSGAGTERIASVIFVSGGGCADFKFFDLPSGCLGGRGGFNGGAGGEGGPGGHIAVQGKIWPDHVQPMPIAPTGSTTTVVMGFNSDNPNFSGGQAIGTVVHFPNHGFDAGSTSGSGGSPAGHASSFPGLFGPSTSPDGVTIVNGAIYAP